MSQIMDLCHLIAIGEQEENLQESQPVHIFVHIQYLSFYFSF